MGDPREKSCITEDIPQMKLDEFTTVDNIMKVMKRRHTPFFSAITVVIAPNPTGDLVSCSNTPMNNMAGENVLIVTKDSN